MRYWPLRAQITAEGGEIGIAFIWVEGVASSIEEALLVVGDSHARCFVLRFDEVRARGELARYDRARGSPSDHA
jgi:hypothetical protein